MLPNIPAMLEAHHGVPMCGAVLNALNTRLDAAALAFILQHGEARALITDTELAPVMREAVRLAGRPLLVIDVDDPEGPGGERIGTVDYEALLAEGDPAFAPMFPADEWQAIALNYTSGTTGNPKGVVYHHRGAHLNAVGNVLVWSMPQFPVYLWTLPMFHCNGWCFPWSIVLQAGTQVCLRRVASETIFAALAEQGVTHLCGAPIVMGMLVNAPEAARRPFAQQVRMMTAASAPPAAVLERMEALGIEVTHVYGLTEVYGPATVCAWQEEWAELDADASLAHARPPGRALSGARRPGGHGPGDDDARPARRRHDRRDHDARPRRHEGLPEEPDRHRPRPSPAAGSTPATSAVMHPDGYVEIKDRSKDIIISGGENISSIEVEGALYRHPAVLEAAVVARPDPQWGESPCAFVTLREGATATAEELIEHCRHELARFKAPRTVVFGPLPKTSTGKIQKFQLREQAKQL